MSIAEALRQAIREEMERDPRVFCIGEDIGVTGGFGGAFTVTLGLSDQFGHERVLDTPISEIGLAGAAVGAAMAGLRPIADVQYGDFLFCMMDQLANQAAKMTYMSGGKRRRAHGHARARRFHRPRLRSTPRASEAFFFHVPGLKVVGARHGLRRQGPAQDRRARRQPRALFRAQAAVRLQGHAFRKGRAQPGGRGARRGLYRAHRAGSVRREGTDVTIVGKLLMVYQALAAADKLAREGICAEVIDPRTLVPFDTELIVASVRKTAHWSSSTRARAPAAGRARSRPRSRSRPSDTSTLRSCA